MHRLDYRSIHRPASRMIATAPRSTTQIETITASSRFAALQHDWDELLHASDADCLFLTWEWLHTWWNHFGQAHPLSVLALRCDGALTAVAPLCMRPASPLRLRPLPALEFLGTGTVGSDYLDLIAGRDHEATAADLLAAELSRSRVTIDWAQLDRRASFAARVARLMALDGWTAAENRSNVCPYIPLSGSTWDGYLRSLGSAHRYDFHRKLKRLKRQYDVRFDQVCFESDRREAIEQVFHLHELRWRARGASDAFPTGAARDFHREFSRLALGRGWLRIFLLRLNDAPAACLYGFFYRRKFYFYQSGFDPVYAPSSLGLILMGLAIERAIGEGAEEYDLLHGNEPYKSHWSRDCRELGRLQLFPPGAAGWLCRRSVAAEQATRRAVRRLLQWRPQPR